MESIIQVLELLFIGVLLMIFLQDIKERKVTISLFIAAFLLGSFIHFQKQIAVVFMANVLINLIVVLLIFSLLWIYTKIKLKQKIAAVFGLGDLLFFCVLAVSLPIFSFLIIFVSSLVFSLLIFIFLKNSIKEKTVPLAGFQGIFFMMIILLNKLSSSVDLYAM